MAAVSGNCRVKRALLNVWLTLARVRRRRTIGIVVGSNSAVRYDRISAVPECNIQIGRDCIINGNIIFERAGASVECGDRCYIGASHLICAERIVLGSDVVISWGVTIVDHNSHAIEWHLRSEDVLDWKLGTKNWEHVKVMPVELGDRVWIGFNATILKGVRIGEGAIVAAGSVVTKDVQPFTIVGGNPARVIRNIARFES